MSRFLLLDENLVLIQIICGTNAFAGGLFKGPFWIFSDLLPPFSKKKNRNPIGISPILFFLKTKQKSNPMVKFHKKICSSCPRLHVHFVTFMYYVVLHTLHLWIWLCLCLYCKIGALSISSWRSYIRVSLNNSRGRVRRNILFTCCYFFLLCRVIICVCQTKSKVTPDFVP